MARIRWIEDFRKQLEHENYSSSIADRMVKAVRSWHRRLPADVRIHVDNVLNT